MSYSRTLAQEEMSDIIRDDTFYSCVEKNFRGVECRVTLSPSCLTIAETGSANKSRIFVLDDVIGCLCMRNKDPADQRNQNQQDAASAFLCVYVYTLSKNFKKSVYRKRETVLLRFCKYSSFVENCDHIAKYELLKA